MERHNDGADLAREKNHKLGSASMSFLLRICTVQYLSSCNVLWMYVYAVPVYILLKADDFLKIRRFLKLSATYSCCVEVHLNICTTSFQQYHFLVLFLRTFSLRKCVRLRTSSLSDSWVTVTAASLAGRLSHPAECRFTAFAPPTPTCSTAEGLHVERLTPPQRYPCMNSRIRTRRAANSGLSTEPPAHTKLRRTSCSSTCCR
jgi:hypothetical protein